MPSFSKHEFISLWPKGPTWKPVPGGDLDNFLNGLTESTERTSSKMDALSELRNPQTTDQLEDLEKENGIISDFSLSENIRRNRLASDIFNTESTGGPTDLQTILDDSEFNLFVYQNDPAVDPNLFLEQNFQMVAGGFNAFAGRADAFAGISGGELLVNGDIIDQTPAFIMQANGPNAFAGNALALAGYFETFNNNKFEYEVPTDPDYWPLIFFVGGLATKDPITNAITAIESGIVPTGRMSELRTTILKYKPTHTWCALIVTPS